MVSLTEFKDWALALPEVTEVPHFDKTSFRINKKIFATYEAQHHRATLKLTPIEQNVFCDIDPTIIYPVDNKWGLQGWTIVELSKVDKEIFRHALTIAYCNTAPSKFSQSLRPS